MAKETQVQANEEAEKKHVDEIVAKVAEAQKKYAEYTQEQVDYIFRRVALKLSSLRIPLAKMAVEETGMGVVEDKVIKNHFASEYIYNKFKNTKTCGILEEDKANGLIKIAEPLGVIAGVIPTTNPTSTAIFKSLIALKTRNGIIFSPHPRAKKCTVETARIILEEAVKAGAPENIIGWIENPSIFQTQYLMQHPQVDIILATGGPGMVKSAYSSGKPALGVGAGNVPALIDETADIQMAVSSILMSKTFDNGMICASEQSVTAVKDVYDAVKDEFIKRGAYILSPKEKEKLAKVIMIDGHLNSAIVGQPAYKIAEMAKISVPEETKALIAECTKVGAEEPFSAEKLSPVLAMYKADDFKSGADLAKELVSHGGRGHTSVLYTNPQNDDRIKYFGHLMITGRVMINCPTSQGAIGDIYNTNTPSLTLGCGSYGKNSVSQNVTTVNLVNKKRIAKRRVNMQWFKVPPKIYFEEDSIQYLEKMEGISRAFIVTDPVMVQLGNVNKILHYLRKREQYCHSEIYSDVESDPSVECIMRGVEAMRAFNPDVIIAIGGGSAIDAAKGMWLFYEHPETSFDGLRQRFLDIRKRAFKFPKLGAKTKLVAIPTTSGTGSEVTSFSVITDKKNGNIKYPLADYALTPDVAIIDPQFTRSMPKSIVADTGLDVLTHAIEAYVSVMASDYTDGLALQATEMVFHYLKASYNGDNLAREKMHNASCIAGMAFTNAFLGLNHSMAHKLGGEFHIPHGRANAILLPYVIAYNATRPTKFAAFPKYKEYIADERYAKLAWRCGLCNVGTETQTAVNSLIEAVRNLMKATDRPMTIRDCGISEEEFLAKVDELSYKAFEDQCTTANPVYPLVSEIKELYLKAYYGN